MKIFPTNQAIINSICNFSYSDSVNPQGQFFPLKFIFNHLKVSSFTQSNPSICVGINSPIRFHLASTSFSRRLSRWVMLQLYLKGRPLAKIQGHSLHSCKRFKFYHILRSYRICPFCGAPKEQGAPQTPPCPSCSLVCSPLLQEQHQMQLSQLFGHRKFQGRQLPSGHVQHRIGQSQLNQQKNHLSQYSSPANSALFAAQTAPKTQMISNISARMPSQSLVPRMQFGLSGNNPQQSHAPKFKSNQSVPHAISFVFSMSFLWT